ncbi:hypothetical protein [Fictibacillus halophilus]|uniref:hypothetical protein n=1 Tax=Fictibacillus halophilus TaxID=1610490 RepID=UPI003398710D
MGHEGVLCLRGLFPYDLEGMGAEAGQVRPFNDAKRRMGSPHTLRKASSAAEIDLLHEQQC